MEGAVAVVLAAGKSRRFKSARPKVLHELCGRPLVEYVLEALREAGIGRVLLVVGVPSDETRRVLSAWTNLEFVEQVDPLGTGHAVLICREALGGHEGPIVVLAGDAPVIRPESIRRLLQEWHASQAACVVATSYLPNPTGYGRIVRDQAGNLQRIVEQRDATPREAAIHEVNSGLYVFRAPLLLQTLEQLQPDNEQGELYLTDCAALLLRDGHDVRAQALLEPDEILGVNRREQLADVERAMQQRIRKRIMEQGVTLVDPANTYIDARVQVGQDTIIYPFTVLSGRVRIGARCRIGPLAFLGDGARVEDGETVGPFCALGRPPAKEES